MKPNLRCCVSCRKIADKEDFWRIVRVYSTRTVQLDHGMGRSAYLCPTAACLQAAQKKNRLARALRVTVPETLYQVLWQRLAEDSASPRTPDPDATFPSSQASPPVQGLG
ncbi:MAG: YlxR family protein [Leptolyngbyaceae cyanobacterium T60_A2020_046]|nr:YlxR family protein [Leptolyngbyaceae cyanobacterium T60_A2020_046]